MLRFFARRLRDAQKEQKGFTLIELLVVVVIIGILAAIAIPVFLNQRLTAEAAKTQSDVRNSVSVQEQCFALSGAYIAAGAYPSPTPLQCDAGGGLENVLVPSENVTLTLADLAPGYSVTGANDAYAGYSYAYDSTTGVYTEVVP